MALTDSQQGRRHESARTAIVPQESTYDDDLHAFFRASVTIPAGATYNEAFMLWLQDVTGSSLENVNDLAALYASQQEDTYNWSSVGSLAAPAFASWDPENDTTLPDDLSFLSLSATQTVPTTTDGTVFWDQETKGSAEVPFARMRRVENLLDSANGSGPFSDVNETGRVAVSVEASNGTLTIDIGGDSRVFTPTATVQRFVHFADVTGLTSITISGTATLNQPMGHLVEVGGIDIPEAYVQHDLEYGNIGVNGVRVFNTANNSTVDGDGVVTFVTGELLKNIRPNPGLSGISVMPRLAIINGVPNVDFSSTVINPTSIFVRINGDDSNDGSSVAQAFRTVTKAFNTAATTGIPGDAFKIDVGAGRWYYDQVYNSSGGGNDNPVDNRAIEIAGAGKNTTFLINAEDPANVSWTDNLDGTYTATVTDAGHAVDFGTLDFRGNPTALTKYFTLIDVQNATEGYFRSGNDITVKPIRAGTPDNDLLVFVETFKEMNWFRNSDVYFHDHAFVGWFLNFQEASGAYKFGQDLRYDDWLVGYSPEARNAFNSNPRATAVSHVYLRRVDCAYGALDNLDYNNQSLIVEERVYSYYAGWQNTSSNSMQNSTGHQTAQLLRTNSNYNLLAATASSNIADVDTDTRSWSYNIVADELDFEHAWVDTVDGAEFTPPVVGYFFDNVTNIQGTPPAFTEFDGIQRAGYFPQNGDNLSGADWPPESSARIEMTVGALAASSVMFGFGAGTGNIIYHTTGSQMIGINGGLFASVTPTTDYAEEVHQFAFSLKTAEMILVDDENGSGQDLTGTAVNGSIHVGCNSAGTQNANGIIHNFEIDDSTKTLSELFDWVS